MSPSPITVLVVGFGRMGRIHVRELLGATHMKLVGIVDPCELTELPAAIPHFSNLTSALVAHPATQAAIIAAPDALHAPLARQCLESNLSVLLEKPACPTFRQAVALDSAFSRAGKILHMGHCEQFQPVFLQLLRELPRLGQLTSIEAIRRSPSPQRIPQTGVALDLAIHDLDLALRIWQTQSHVLPTLSNFQMHSQVIRNLIGTPTSIQAHIQPQDLPPLHLRAEWAPNVRQRNLILHGTNGVLDADLSEGLLHYHPRHAPSVLLPVQPGPSTIFSEHSVFCNAIKRATTSDNTLPLLALGLAEQVASIADENILPNHSTVNGFSWESLAFAHRSVVAL